MRYGFSTNDRVIFSRLQDTPKAHKLRRKGERNQQAYSSLLREYTCKCRYCGACAAMAKPTLAKQQIQSKLLAQCQRLPIGYFNHAIKFYGLPKNPSKECGKIQEKRPELHFWTLAQFNQFMQTVDGDYPAYTMFLLLFWTGMRLGELLALTMNDFDFEKHTVKINKTYHRFQKEDLILPPKTERSNRLVTLPAFLEDEVKAYTLKLYDYTPSERLFPLSKDMLAYRLKAGTQTLGLPKIRVHDLRHPYVKSTTKKYEDFFQLLKAS